KVRAVLRHRLGSVAVSAWRRGVAANFGEALRRGAGERRNRAALRRGGWHILGVVSRPSPADPSRSLWRDSTQHCDGRGRRRWGGGQSIAGTGLVASRSAHAVT